MKTLIMKIAVLIAILSTALLFGCSDLPKTFKSPSPTELPEGYFLQISITSGEYRPVATDGRVLFWSQDSGTRQEAIDRAWRQFEYNNPNSSFIWVHEDALIINVSK